MTNQYMVCRLCDESGHFPQSTTRHAGVGQVGMVHSIAIGSVDNSIGIHIAAVAVESLGLLSLFLFTQRRPSCPLLPSTDIANLMLICCAVVLFVVAIEALNL